LRPRQRDQDQPKHDDEPGAGRVLAPWSPRQSSERLDARRAVQTNPNRGIRGDGRLSLRLLVLLDAGS
jgi:hypothetical protein